MNIKVSKSDPAPFYQQIKSQIRKNFIDQGIEEGSPLPSLEKIADKAGVSLGTVDRALRELVREGVCYRRPKKGTFFGNMKNVVRAKAMCGVCHAYGIDTIEQDLVQAIIYRGISRSAHRHDMDVLFLPPEPSETISFYLSRSKLELKGVIMLHWEDMEVGNKLAQDFPGIKFIFLNYYSRDFELLQPNIYGVFNDDYGGAYQAVDYLASKGHREIAALSTKIDNENYRQRLEGYKDALEDNGIKYKSGLVYEIESGDDFKTGSKMAKGLFKSGLNPSAIFCVSDWIAEGAVKYLKRTGKDGSTEVCGYDNLMPDISRNYRFSTVAVDFKKIGEKATDILAAPKNRVFPKIIRVPAKLLIRNDY